MLITTTAIRKEYGDVVAVKDLNLEIPQGAVYGLIGPNGAGKTTLFRMITGLLEPTSGSVEIEGIDVWRDPLHAFAKIGYLPDFFSLYDSLTVWECLDYFAHAYKLDAAKIPARIDEVLRLVNLVEKRNERVSSLSRGMMQRLGIGKTIIHDPTLVILDEPAAGLDPLARRDFMQLVLSLHGQGKTILISSHILSELAEVCTHVGILDHGSFVKTGEIAQIIAQGKTKKIEVAFMGDGKKLLSYLQRLKSVSLIEPAEGHVKFEFSGDDAGVVLLNKRLSADFSLLSFSVKKKDISDIFMEVAAQ